MALPAGRCIPLAQVPTDPEQDRRLRPYYADADDASNRPFEAAERQGHIVLQDEALMLFKRRARVGPGNDHSWRPVTLTDITHVDTHLGHHIEIQKLVQCSSYEFCWRVVTTLDSDELHVRSSHEALTQ